jgi:GNAT superfamily N-acetyltransferase
MLRALSRYLRGGNTTGSRERIEHIGGAVRDPVFGAGPVGYGIRVEIIRLGPDDWEAFRDLRRASLADAPHAFGSTLTEESALGESDWRGKLATRAQFAARTDGKPFGTVGGCRDGEIIELVSMWVDPRVRLRGVGTALVARVIAHARAQRCRELRLWVSEGNVAAERLYVRHGFVPTGLVQPIRPNTPRIETEWALAL